MQESVKVKVGTGRRLSQGVESVVAAAWLSYFLFTILLVGGVSAYLLSWPLYALGYLWRPARRAADRIMNFAVYFLLAIQPWLKLEISGAFHHSNQGFLYVSNHRSHLDAFILLSRIPGVRILARRSLFKVPGLGLMMWFMRQIPSKRGDLASFQNAFKTVGQRLRGGESVHVFPEMTRCPQGFHGTQAFVLAPFMTALQAGVPVVPIAFQGTDDAWPKGGFGVGFRMPVRVAILDPVDPSHFASPQELRDEVQKKINQALKARLP